MSPISSPISAAQHALDTEPQYIDAPMSAAAAFLVLVVKDDDVSIATARSVVASTDDLVRDVRIRADRGVFTCNVGISHRVWGPLTGKPAPSELAPLQEVRGATHTAVATAGDLLYHIRADSTDLIIEFEKILLEAIGDAVSFPSAWSGAPIRLKSVQNAVDQARSVAAHLTGKPVAYPALPWFWSDQGDLKLQKSLRC